jgi:acetyl-CoA carboxylase biotin carboxyl carrier protein
MAEKPAKLRQTNKPLSSSSSSPVDFNNIIEVKSPMVGVFYSAPSPGSEPFVKIGDRVKKGDVLCIIEAMKLMNEILREHEGEIVDICAENEQIVEVYSDIVQNILKQRCRIQMRHVIEFK